MSQVYRNLGWIPSRFDPARKVARPTLVALERLLKTHAPSAVPALAAEAHECSVPLARVPALSEVGGVARVESGAECPVAIARVGRSSFVGYRLDPAGLTEVPVSFDDRTGTLVIRPNR